MITRLIGSLVVLVAVAAPLALHAQSATKPSANPSSDDIIKALTPGSDAGQPRFRGLRILSAKPGTNGASTADAGQAPAISLNVQFALNSADLTLDAKDIVHKLATAMNSEQLSSYRFQVEGHTDSTGTADTNLALSQARANTVRDDLISEYHVPADRLVAVGKGQTEPLDPADPSAAANRRVQIVNLGAAAK